MKPYTRPDERKIGALRPRVSHISSLEIRDTPSQREQAKMEVRASRRAIKKSARQHLRQELAAELRTAAPDSSS